MKFFEYGNGNSFINLATVMKVNIRVDSRDPVEGVYSVHFHHGDEQQTILKLEQHQVDALRAALRPAKGSHNDAEWRAMLREMDECIERFEHRQAAEKATTGATSNPVS